MKDQRICPWWLGYSMIIPFRKYRHNPQKILGSLIKKGMYVIDYGCAMGYFSVHIAKMTGSDGKVYAVDIQKKMLDKLVQRTRKRGLEQIVEPRLVGGDYKVDEFKNKIDFALLFMVVHEVTDQAALFVDLFSMLKPGAKILFAEPKGHVTPANFEKSIELAQHAGFTVSEEEPSINGLAVLLQK